MDEYIPGLETKDPGEIRAFMRSMARVCTLAIVQAISDAYPRKGKLSPSAAKGGAKTQNLNLQSQYCAKKDIASAQKWLFRDDYEPAMSLDYCLAVLSAAAPKGRQVLTKEGLRGYLQAPGRTRDQIGALVRQMGSVADRLEADPEPDPDDDEDEEPRPRRAPPGQA